jgi:hypothetical protein
MEVLSLLKKLSTIIDLRLDLSIKKTSGKGLVSFSIAFFRSPMEPQIGSFNVFKWKRLNILLNSLTISRKSSNVHKKNNNSPSSAAFNFTDVNFKFSRLRNKLWKFEAIWLVGDDFILFEGGFAN